MTTCDVLVVGGGPAGSTCAWRLRRGGAEVLVWDRERFPRDKVCAGWITPQVLTELELDPATYSADGRTLQPIRGFRVSRFGDASARVSYWHSVSFGIRRCEFDEHLLRRSGAALRLGEPVRDLRRQNGEWIVNESVRAKVLVGAGGHFCPVARQLGARLGEGEPIIAAHEVELPLSREQLGACRVEPEVPELFFTRDFKGYGWAFRKGDYLNIGLGRQDPVKLGTHVQNFFAFLQREGKIPDGLSLKPHGHPYLLYGQSARPLVGDGALVIGDAAGLAYPRSGEGIRPAVESGLLAAEAILTARGGYDRERLAPYVRRVAERFGPRHAGRGLTDLLPERIASALAGRLVGMRWFARRVVLDRWFFHAAQPALQTLDVTWEKHDAGAGFACARFADLAEAPSRR